MSTLQKRIHQKRINIETDKDFQVLRDEWDNS